jgi:DNA polymerase-3 subunit gamma/tau
LKEIGDNLRKIAAADGIAISDKGLAWIAAAGDGSMRDSQSIFDQIVSYAGIAVDDEKIEEILGLTDRKFVVAVARAVLDRNAARCLQLIDEGYYAGLDMQVFYQLLVDYFRNLVLTKVVAVAAGIAEMTQEDWSNLVEQTREVSRETLQRLLEILMAEEETMRRTQNPRLVLEMSLTRMAYLTPLIPIDEILARMAALERNLAAGIAVAEGDGKAHPKKVSEIKVPVVSVAPVEAVREEAVTDYGISDKTRAAGSEGSKGDVSWEGFKVFVKQSNPPLSSKLDSGQLLSREDNRLIIGFPKGYVFFEDVEKHQHEALNELARNYFRCPALEVKIEALHVDGAGNNGKKGNGSAQQIIDIRQDALKHPLVQKVMDIFENAEIRDVIPRQMMSEKEE